MSFYGQDHVVTCPGIIIWDGINNPDQDPKGNTTHELKVAIPGNAPERQELEQLATTMLNNSEFRGQLPPGGNWPISEIDVNKFGQEFAGYVGVKGKTWLGKPEVLDRNGQPVPAMTLANSIYPGASVVLLLSAYPYNNVQKGIGFALDGVQIHDDTLPRLNVGGSTMSRDQVAAAFGGGAAPPPAQGGQATPPPAAGPGNAPPAGPPAQQGGTPVQPNAGALNPPGQGAAPPPPAAAPPAQQGPVMTEKAGGVPYDQWIAAGWTDDQLKAHGYMQ